MFDHIQADMRRYNKAAQTLSIVGALRLFWYAPSLQALVVYRMGRWLRTIARSPLMTPISLLLMPFYWLLAAYVRLAYDIHLHQTADIEPGFYIGHFGGIRVRHCRIGQQCAIQQEVCLEPSAAGDKGPQIGNRVWIGAHSKVRGAMTIGDRATIGAGTTITEDVAGGCLILGNPPRVLSRDYDNSSFL